MVSDKNDGFCEALAPAKGLLRLVGVSPMPGRKQVTYHTLLLPQHGILFAEDLPVESFYPGQYGMSVRGVRQRYEIFARLPQLMADPVDGYGAPARPLPSKREADHLIGAGQARFSRCSFAVLSV